MKRPWAETELPKSGGEFVQTGSGKDATFEHTPAEKKRAADAAKAEKKPAPQPPVKE